MTAVSLTVNGRKVAVEIEPRTHLGDFLRDQLRLTGTHLGCEHGVCGACTVLLGGAPIRSCITYAVACDGQEIRTIEGFEDDSAMAALRAAFSREHGLQCGFCTPGMLIASRDIVHRLPQADDGRIRIELAGNLCRCTGYLGIVKAVRSVLDERRQGATPMPAGAVAPARAAVPASFVPAVPTMVPAAASATEPAEEAARQGWTRFEESFAIEAPPSAVWAALQDFPKVAACLPGAELSEHDDRAVKGRLRVKLGPISASFAGSATVQSDEGAKTAVIKGAGTDTSSRTRTRGEVRYRLTPEAEGLRTRVALVVEYDLQGPLAQFSRSSLAREFGGRIVAEFASNLDAALTGDSPAPPQPSSINVLALLREFLWQRLRRLCRAA